MIPPAVIAGGGRPVALDPYAAAVTGLTGLVAYWRLGDAGTAVLADASGHGHDGSYPMPPTAFGASRLTWDTADNKAVNFGGSGYGQIAHNAAFVLPNGTLAFYFRANALTPHQTLIQKGTGFVLEARSDGHLRLTIGSQTLTTQNYAVPPIVAGRQYHVAVAWGGKRVRLYLDGRQVAWSMKHQAGLTGTSSWQLARSTAGINANVRLDEVALWNRELSRAEMDAISEYIRGLPYGAPESTVTVSSASALESAVNAAPPGRHILVANGTYNLSGLNFNGMGEKRRPIVIRPQNNRGDVVFTGSGEGTSDSTINLNGRWIVIADIYMTNPRILLGGNGHYNRITRCRFRSIERYCVDLDASQPGNCVRVDHCDAADYVNGSTARGVVRIRDNQVSGGYGKQILVDHCYIHDITPTTGSGAHETIAFGSNTVNSLTTYPANTVERCLFTNIDVQGEGEVITVKTNDVLIDRCTFADLPGNNASMYLSLRGGWHDQVVSCWFENIAGSSGGLNAWGPDHYIAGCRFASANARVAPGGNTTLAERIAGGEGYPHALDTQIIGCTGDFSVGTIWSSNSPAVFPATNVRIEACTGTITFGEHIGTAQSETTDEPFTAAVKLTSSDVGMAADDPLVPDGWL